MKTTRYIILIAAVLLAVSCTKDFASRNTNKEQATREMLTYDNLATGSAFAQMTRNVLPTYQLGEEEYGSANYQIIEDLAGNIFAGYTGAINSGWAYNNQYDITAGTWYRAMFNDSYVRLMAAWNQLDAWRDSQPQVAALGDIMKVAGMHRVTDTYGPIPYVSLREGELHQSYDSQESIYKAFFDELDGAISVLTEYVNANPGAKIVAAYDNVYGGDISSWIKFANTLRLRLAMRVCYADDALARAQADAALANPFGILAVKADAAMCHKPASGAWEYPLYVIQHNFNDSAAGATIVSYMNGYSDPRLEKYFTPGSDALYHGVRNGINITNAYKNSTLLSKVNCTNADPLVWMQSAEAWFLRAEYELRWGSESAAKDCYEQGIRVSFDAAGATGAEAYIANATALPGNYADAVVTANSVASALSDIPVAWLPSGTFEKHLEQIITQKYIAIFPCGQEAWSEFRRTSYPKVIPVAVNKNSGVISTERQIRRLNYPDTEYSTNTVFVQAAVEILNSESSSGSGDNGGTALWWDKK